MVKIFLTGATGYVGGQALHSIITAFPDMKEPVACLVRDDKKGELIREKYGERVRLVKGDLEATDVIERESRDADVVFHMASTSDLSSAKAIAQGLSGGNRAKPGHWIQMSGASLFCVTEVQTQSYGHAATTSYDDTSTGLTRVREVIKLNPQRTVDNLVTSQPSSSVRTALIVGGLIYGPGQGPGNQRSIQAPEITRNVLAAGEGFRLGDGANTWSHVHVQDLGRLFVDLLTAAVERSDDHDADDLWNENGIYLPETGDMTFGDLCTHITREAHSQNLIASPKVTRGVTATEADAMSPHAARLWGTNAVLRSRRANDLLGWKPVAPALGETLKDLVRAEAERARLGK